MRVCFISRRYFPAISGMSVYAQNLLAELVRAGHDVTMISQYRDDAFGRGVYGGGPPPPVAGVRVIGLESLGEQAGGDFERDIATMVATIVAEDTREKFDILHAQYGYPNGWAALLAARQTRTPVVVSIQGGDGHWVGSCCEPHRLAMRRVLDHANAVLIGARSFAGEVTGRLGTDPARFTIVPGAVDTDRFTPGPPRPPSPPVILYHGRVDARKGVLDLIDAVALLRPTAPPFTVTVSGIGPDVAATEARIAAHGLRDIVRMTGHAPYDDVPALYREADIFASPTYAEGFSNTILEAMASGLACVSCRAVGVVDCLRDDENGLLTDPGDIPALAAGLRRLIEDPATRARLAAAALAECRETYSWTQVGAQIMAVYAAVRGQSPDTAFDPSLPKDDPPCRFRAAPHLL